MFRNTSYGSVLPPNHTLSGRGDVGRLPRIRHVARLAGGAPLRWFTVGLKHDEIHVIEARSCNREEDDFWRQSENTDLLEPSDCGRIIRGKRSDQYQCGGPVVSVSCSIATVTRRQIAAPS